MAHHNIIGKKGEEIALDFLAAKGYTILEKSWRFGHKEIDIIATNNKNTLIFVEVKTRTNNYWGKPEDFVSIKKQKFLIEASEQYIYSINFNGESRFDVIAIIFNNNNYEIEHLENMFFPEY